MQPQIARPAADAYDPELRLIGAVADCAARGAPVRVVLSGGWGSAAVVVPAAWFARPLFASAILGWVAWTHAEGETAEHNPTEQVEDEYHPETPRDAVCLVGHIVTGEPQRAPNGLWAE